MAINAAENTPQAYEQIMDLVMMFSAVLAIILLAVIAYLHVRIVQANRNRAFIKPTPVQRPRKTLKHAGQDIEKQLLNLASARGGILTVVEASYHADLHPEIVESAMESLANGGFVEIRKSIEGAVRYHFIGILTNQERKTAKSLDNLLRE